MGRPLPFRALVIGLTGALLFGCAPRPPEKPIVLRRPLAERRQAARRPAVTAPPAAASETPATDAAPPAPSMSAEPVSPLTPEQKARLFEDFDRYLARPAP